MQNEFSQHIDFHIAWRLKQLREYKNMSREQLAALIDIPAHDIYKFEAAHIAMNAQDLAMFSKGLDVTPNDFFTQLNTTDINFEKLVPTSSAVPRMNTFELVRHFLNISCAKSRQSFGLATRQAGRHY